MNELNEEVEGAAIACFHDAAMRALEEFKSNLDKSEAVLRDVFPPHVLRQLVDGHQVKAEQKEEVSRRTQQRLHQHVPSALRVGS